MATLSVLGQLMGGLVPPAGPPQPYDAMAVNKERAASQTALIQLEELKRSQASEATIRQFFAEHPELALGGGMQSTLGGGGMPPGPPGAAPLPQQQVMPGQPPGAPAVVPGGQDLSRFAGVSPQGGGPIPPTVMGQVMPTSTPPMQSTLGGPGPQQPGQDPRQQALLELVRRDPAAGMAIQERMFKIQEGTLTRDIGRMEYFGRVFQGANDQATWDEARREAARNFPQLAAQVPPVYSKEAKEGLIKRATDVKTSADLQIKTLHEQTEQMKLGLQLQNAGYQGLGEGVTSILRGLSEEQVKQFGGRTTPAAVAYATEQGRKVAGMSDAVKTELAIMKVNPIDAKPEQLAQAQKNIQDRELAKAGEAERLKFQQEQEQQKTLPLQDARKEDAGLFVSKGTGQTIPGTTPYGQVKQLQDEKDPEKGVVKLANLDEKKQLTTLKQLEPVLQQYADLVQYAYGTDPTTGKKGPLADYTRSPGDVIDAAYKQLEQSDPTFQAKRRALQGQLQSVVRGLGARGDLNEAELKAATEMLANFDASMGFGLNLGVGIGAGGPGPMFGFKPSISIPDSPATGVALANELIGTVNRRIGSILQHEGYAKTPTITLQTGTPPTTTTTGTPPAGGTAQPTTPPAPTTPAPTPPATPKGRQPGEIPVLGGPGMPEQYLPAPGQQSQARPGTSGVRVAGGPKFMELRDVQEAMRQTGKSRREVEAAARARGYTVLGSRLPLPEETAIG